MMWGPAIVFICYAAGCMEYSFEPAQHQQPLYQETEEVCEAHWREWAEGEQAKGTMRMGATAGAPKQIVVQCKDYEDKGPLI